ncbi:hypothetical protein ACHAXS_007606 [Conticribra weissflogii]
MTKFHSCGITEIDVGTPPVASIDWKSFWVLGLYPGGSKTSEDDQISLFLKLASKGSEAQICFEILLLDSNGSAVGVKRVPSNKFHKDGLSWRWRDFMKRSEIVSKEGKILNEGTLSIRLAMRQDIPRT